MNTLLQNLFLSGNIPFGGVADPMMLPQGIRYGALSADGTSFDVNATFRTGHFVAGNTTQGYQALHSTLSNGYTAGGFTPSTERFSVIFAALLKKWDYVGSSNTPAAFNNAAHLSDEGLFSGFNNMFAPTTLGPNKWNEFILRKPTGVHYLDPTKKTNCGVQYIWQEIFQAAGSDYIEKMSEGTRDHGIEHDLSWLATT